MRTFSCSSRREEDHSKIMFCAHPHPDPLPQGEGTAVGRFEFSLMNFEPLTAFSWRGDWKQFSLAQRERAGVRENRLN